MFYVKYQDNYACKFKVLLHNYLLVFNVRATARASIYQFREIFKPTNLLVILQQLLRERDRMSAFIENILQKLLTPDSSIIKHATKQLLEFYVSEKCINGFFDIVKTSTTSQVDYIQALSRSNQV